MKQKEINFRKLIISSSALVFISLMIKLISTNKEFVEKYYSTLIYARASVFLRMLTGWIPFSVGDLLLALAIFYGLFKFSKWIYSAFRGKITLPVFLYGFIKIIHLCLTIYIVFNLFWGLNYNRMGISSQLNLTSEKYTTEDLRRLTADLVKRVNATHSVANMNVLQFESYKSIFENAARSFKNASFHYPFLNYDYPCIKRGLSSSLYNYLGIAGYYNPVSAEAQINTSIPYFLLPYIISHEIAHQLGYASEKEANFIAYFVSKDSYENAFRYSAYFTLFNYANRQLFFRDSSSAETNLNSLDSIVKIDETVYQSLSSNKSGIGTHYSTAFYNYYLEANNQAKGLNAYDDVITLLIAYQKRYGDL